MKYDICIIGSGAGAGPVAYELSRAGFKVLVLEKGGSYQKEDFFKDEIGVCRRSTFTPALDEEQHVIEDIQDDVWTRTPTSKSGWDFWNGNIVGGSSNFMSGYFHRLKPMDFRLKSQYGNIKGANIVDWPISYADLEPYYTKAEKVIGISGKVVKHPCQEPRSTPDFPYYPTSEHRISSWFDTVCAKQGFYSIPTPRAVLPYAVGNRQGCEYAGYCGSYGCSSGAKGSSREALLNKALKTNNLTIKANSFVKKLHSKEGKVISAEYLDKNKSSHKVEARIFVVAAQAIESSRLLLNSANAEFPFGLANNSRQVGENLIFSSGGSGTGEFKYEDFDTKEVEALKQIGPFVNRSLQDWYEIKEKGKSFKGGTIDFLFEHPNAVSRARRAMYDGELVWGNALKKRLLNHFTTRRVFTFEVFCDWTPTDDCFVSLDETIKDKWGMPVAKVRIGSHPHDIKVGEVLAAKAETVLKEMGARNISSSISPAPPANLQAGGCRFGNDPKTSVLDKNCKAHELENLYVSDGSFMPTGGAVPFTWTIYANSFRVADEIIKHLTSMKKKFR
ncbi:GMC family oxidoreductase [Sulfurimonas sp. MAG313]|nr:GMC family oxidoreductase [Sulfurimonas sp. MAG313]MDF1880457.1 GMC family oxidoreductase [Sulfurimonas sp. MAG313]